MKLYLTSPNQKYLSLDNVQELFNLSEQQVLDIQAEFDDIIQQNTQIKVENTLEYETKLNNIEEVLKDANIIFSGKNSRGNKKYHTWFMNNIIIPLRKLSLHNVYNYMTGIRTKQIVINNVKFTLNNSSDLTIHQLWTLIHKEYEYAKQQNQHKDKLIMLSLAYALKNNITFDENNLPSPEESIKIIRDIASDVWLKEHYPEGTPVDISCCDYCDTWYFGDRRCSCSNRRMSYEIEGDIIDGFYLVPEAY